MFYTCTKCGYTYASSRGNHNCPRCGSASSVPNLVVESLFAWYYHREVYGSGVPPVYATLDEHDRVIFSSCMMLEDYIKTRPLDEKEFIEQYVNRLYPGVDEEARSVMTEFFTTLLDYFKNRKVNLLLRVDDDQNKEISH